MGSIPRGEAMKAILRMRSIVPMESIMIIERKALVRLRPWNGMGTGRRKVNTIVPIDCER